MTVKVPEGEESRECWSKKEVVQLGRDVPGSREREMQEWQLQLLLSHPYLAFLVVDLVLGFVLGLALPQLPPPDDCAWNS